MSDLFREEALDAQARGAGVYGRPTGVMPPAWSRITWLLTFFMAGVMIFLFTVELPRTETVRGKLVPVAGETKVYAQEPGIATQVYVHDEAFVELGDPLIELTSERYLVDGTALSQATVAAIDEEIFSLEAQRAATRSTAEIALRDIEARRRESDLEKADGQAQRALIAERLNTARQREAALTELLDQGLVAETEYHQRRDARLQLESLHAETLARIERAELSQTRLDIEAERIRSDLERDLSGLAQRLTQANQQKRQTTAGARHTILASMAGQVSTLQVKPGEAIEIALPLMSILPGDAELVAELYLPSRAIGFVEPGQEVKIKYDAYPYQKYGVFYGTVESSSPSALRPDELGIMTQSPELLYRVVVSLGDESERPHKGSISPQSNMELTADIVLEKRRLWDWLLEPLRTVQ
ncbi:MAG: HlyD family secretion protein [Hyphomonadaceae bacterium]|nr:HlyD family secretion protein [Hyphomonadaceae bacterium]